MTGRSHVMLAELVSSRQMFGWAKTLLLIGCVAGLAGCVQYPETSVPPAADLAMAPSLYRSPIEPEYRIETGDALHILSYSDKALDQTVTVRPDGRVSLLLLGEIQVAGKTVKAVNSQLARDYDNRLPDRPDVTVAMSEMAGLSIYIGGEVKTPTVLPLKGGLTVLQAVEQAGGYLPSANQHQIIILRRNPDGTFFAFQDNEALVLQNKAAELYLRPRDIVYVPKSDIGQLDQFVDQYINKVVPRAVLTTFGYTVLHTTGSATLIKAP